jgi:4-oxalocrotonate tautomerase
MPHVIVKMYAGRSEAQKARIADEIAKSLMESVPCSAASISISIEDVEPSDWAETVYGPETVGKPGTLYRKPGYDPL